MTKAQFITAVSAEAQISTKEATQIIDSIDKVMQTALLENDDVPFLDGKFKVQEVKAKPEKAGRNPKTGEPITISAKPAGRKVIFKAGKKLKDAIK